jgi:hypothetical protein
MAKICELFVWCPRWVHGLVDGFGESFANMLYRFQFRFSVAGHDATASSLGCALGFQRRTEQTKPFFFIEAESLAVLSICNRRAPLGFIIAVVRELLFKHFCFTLAGISSHSPAFLAKGWAQGVTHGMPHERPWFAISC